MKTGILGSGSWGTALAQVLADNNQEVLLYGRNPEAVKEINEKHTNQKYFGNLVLNPELKATNRIEDLKDSDVIVLAVPSKEIEGMVKKINPYLKDQTILVNVAKGFHPVTYQRMSDVIRNSAAEGKASSVVSLIGPSHAEEVVQRQLTSIDAVSLNEKDAKTIQDLFSNDYLRIYTGNDEVGSELGAALKNVMAIASGILKGLGYEDNTQAALITRGLQELIRFGQAYGADPRTFIGLTGIGDLVVTCISNNSRNFQAGYQIGKENSVDPFYQTNTKTVEGIRTAQIVHELAKEKQIEMPICEEVFQILYEGKEPRLCAKDLMLRELKNEFS